MQLCLKPHQRPFWLNSISGALRVDWGREVARLIARHQGNHEPGKQVVQQLSSFPKMRPRKRVPRYGVKPQLGRQKVWGSAYFSHRPIKACRHQPHSLASQMLLSLQPSHRVLKEIHLLPNTRFHLTSPKPAAHINLQPSAMDSKAVKDAVMQQVVQESNLANARVLIEVRSWPSSRQHLHQLQPRRWRLRLSF